LNPPPVLRLGFIGLGQAVARMLQQYDEIAKLPYRIAAAADPREHAMARFRAEFGGDVFTDAEAMLRADVIDVAYIATPPELHREHVELAAKYGKHIICEKPMALTIADCDAMVRAADRAGVKLLAGHTHSFDAPIRKMREIIDGGTLGRLISVNTSNYNEFNPRPWTGAELRSTYGPILNQGPHQVDIVRQLGGGMVRSVRAQTIWDSLRGVEGGWMCFLEFENGVPATLSYDARGFFDTAELFWWVGEGGSPRDPSTNATMRRNYRTLTARGGGDLEAYLESQKEVGRYGAAETDPEIAALWGYAAPGSVVHQPFFGITIASCERGAMRQSRDGLIVYGDDSVTEVPLAKERRARAAELMDMYDGIIHGRPLYHDGAWGRATIEVCLGMIESARTRREVSMQLQVPT
jgi:phthalate 4,5-cis-dihydrodiol dehydrogenase